MKKIICISIIFISLFSTCRKPSSGDIISAEGPQTLTLDSIFNDTTKILMSELPVYFDSTEVLIHYIGFDEISSKNRSSSFLSKSDPKGYDNYNYGFTFDPRGYFSGNIMNLYFENAATGEQNFLTDQVINITYGLYLRELGKDTNQHYILYQVYDKDYNYDDKLDRKDLKALYISTIDGKNFAKLTADYHNFSEGRYISINKRYYFKTIEGLNNHNNGIEPEEAQHYYYIDFATQPYKVVEYNLINKIKNK